MGSLLALALASSCAASVAPEGLRLVEVGRFRSGPFGRSATEVAVHDAARQRLLVVNVARGIDAVDIKDPAHPVLAGSFAVRGPTSVAVHGDTVAVLSAPEDRSKHGELVLLGADLKERARIEVGHNPDMVAFTPDGKVLLVGNEGEEDAASGTDPEGSISVVDISEGPGRARVRTADFRAFDPQRERLRAEGANLAVPGRTVAQQAEPEYVAVSPDGAVAFVTLQEMNALAVVDVKSATVRSMHGLGLKDFSRCGLDPSDRDGGIRIAPWPVAALRQPDAVVAWTEGGATWLATSNEGEKRDAGKSADAVRVADLKLDAGSFPPGTPGIMAKEGLGRLEVCAPLCDTDGDGDADRLVAFGGRGVTIWRFDGTTLTEHWDSGSECERIVAERMPAAFNADHEKGPSADERSDAKGPEPEGLATGIVDGRRLLFAGLERAGGVVAWDITDPSAPRLVDYVNPRDPAADLAKDADKDGVPDDAGRAGDLGPEGLVFIPATASPTGRPMLAVCNEVSGTLTLWEVRAVP